MVNFANINQNNVNDFVSYCIKNNLNTQEIQNYLLSNHVDENLAELINKKIRYQISFNVGIKFLFFGSILLILAFLAPFVLNFNQAFFHISLYGFTSVGGILGIYGLYKILG